MVSKKYNKIKKLILLVWLLHAALLLKAQMPRWIMSPSYDRIYLDAEAPVLFSDSLGVTSLWNLKGQRMATTVDMVHPFTEGYAVVTAQDQEVLKGFYNTKGEFIALKDLSVAYSYPYFSNGFLLVNNNGLTQFVSPDGKMQDAAYQKKQLTLDGGEPSEYLIDMQDSLVLKTQAGKKEIVRFVFSQTLRPQHYRFMDYTREFKAKEVEPQKLPSSLVRVGKLGTTRELMNQPNAASAAVQTDSTRQDTAEPASAILQDLIPEVAPM